MDLTSMQIMSVFVCFLATIILSVSPHKGGTYGVYNIARKLIYTALALIAIQFVLQIIFGFRLKNPDWGAACNLVCFTPAMLCIDWAILVCVRAGKVRMSENLVGAIVFVAVLLLCGTGVLASNPIIGHYLILIASVVSGLCCMHYFGVMYMEYRRMYKQIQYELGNPIEVFIGWMRWSVLMMAVATLLLFVGIIFPVALLPYSFVMWSTVFYFIGRFCSYGRYVKAINDLVNNAEVPSEQALEMDVPCVSDGQNDTQESAPATTEEQATDILSEEKIERLACWINRKGYCTKGLTIVELAGLVGTNRTTLSQYINVTKKMPFRDWINHLRCSEAERMMRNRPSLPVEDVAEHCGFSSRNYFDQVFLAYAGVTPANFRQQLLK